MNDPDAATKSVTIVRLDWSGNRLAPVVPGLRLAAVPSPYDWQTHPIRESNVYRDDLMVLSRSRSGIGIRVSSTAAANNYHRDASPD
jgi:hypothetical protein